MTNHQRLVLGVEMMLFSLTESWCESPYCRVELVWYLVLKTMGADELLRTEVGGTKAVSKFDVSGVGDDFESTVDFDGNEIRKEDVLNKVQNMTEEQRWALFDGSFFLVGGAPNDVEASAAVLQLLREPLARYPYVLTNLFVEGRTALERIQSFLKERPVEPW